MNKIILILSIFTLITSCQPKPHKADIEVTYFDGSTEELEVEFFWNHLDRIEELRCGCTWTTSPSRCNVKKVKFLGHTTGWIKP